MVVGSGLVGFVGFLIGRLGSFLIVVVLCGFAALRHHVLVGVSSCHGHGKGRRSPFVEVKSRILFKSWWVHLHQQEIELE